MSQWSLFLRQFRENFFQMGAILPSSAATARAMVAYLPQQSAPIQVLEVGAGTGAFTGYIVDILSAGDALDIVEINPTLMTVLQQRLERENHAHIAEMQIQFIIDDVCNLPSNIQYDYIVFSLPLTNFPPALVKEILTAIVNRIKPGGGFSYIKYIFLWRFKYLFGNAAVKQAMQANQAIINDFTARYQIKQRAVLRNVPPAWIYYWQKPSAEGGDLA